MTLSLSPGYQSHNTDQSVDDCEMQQPSKLPCSLSHSNGDEPRNITQSCKKRSSGFGKTPTSGDFYVNTATTSYDEVIHDSPKDDGRGCCLQREHSLLSEIKTQNHMIRCMLADVLKELRDLKKPERDSTIAQSIFVKYNIEFPIANDEDLNSFEEEVKIEEHFIEAVNELAKFGGANPYNFIKRTTSMLMKDTLLVSYSWLGRKGKRPFYQLNIAKLLIRKYLI
ncbi:uncharacterized protein LOC116160623 [Photinus pyralis]|uniref:uncharacterized protein LOC116160623 n=1 Tax=Photinus pyralis TaxID=7054 RepID=UPI0012676AC9|nr:uncharacterized protein LOC116160623 [Photinus pyralis]